SWDIGLAQLPFLLEQERDLVPVALTQCVVHVARDLGYLSKVFEYTLVAVDMRFEDLPVVDARLALRSGIYQNKSRFDFLGRDVDCFAMNTVRIEMNCIHSTIKGGVIVLAAGWHTDELCFDILSNYTQLFA